MKTNKIWNRSDLEGKRGIVLCRYIKTVKVYCNIFFNAVNLNDGEV